MEVKRGAGRWKEKISALYRHIKTFPMLCVCATHVCEINYLDATKGEASPINIYEMYKRKERERRKSSLEKVCSIYRGHHSTVGQRK